VRLGRPRKLVKVDTSQSRNLLQSLFAVQIDPRATNAATAIVVYAFGAAIVSIFAAQILERRLKAQLPQTLPYRWGYYVGCICLASAPFALLFACKAAFFAANEKWGLFGTYLVYTAHSSFLTLCGWFIIKRRWWAWVIGTIFSFNMLFWITNSIYGPNRREELSGKRKRGQSRAGTVGNR